MQALKEKEMNFIDAMNRREKITVSKNMKQYILLAIPVLMFVIVTGTMLFLYTVTNVFERRTQNIRDELISEEVLQKQTDLQLLKSDVSGLNYFKSSYERLETYFQNQIEIDKKTLQTVIEECLGKVALDDVAMENGYLTLTCHSMEYKEAARYVQRLEKSQQFSRVNYQGFEKDGNKYVFTVICLYFSN